MDESLLKEMALTTGGAYVPARTRAYDLGSIYDDHLAKLTRGEIQAKKRKRYREQFQLFGGIGLALLMIEMLVPRFRSNPDDQLPMLRSEKPKNDLRSDS